jgi:hypothetical protein
VADLRSSTDGGTMVESRSPGQDARQDVRHEAHDAKGERVPDPIIRGVRATDIEPYTGLRYLSKLFRFMGVILVLLLIAEVATGIYTQGTAAVPTLLGEASRLIVLAGVLWGTGDLAHLLIDVGHDVRAGRILMARLAHAANVPPLSVPRTAAERAMPAETVVTTRRALSGDHPDDENGGPPIP